MFDIGFWEMAFIAVIALLVIGPERLPGVARTLGLWIGKARRMINDVKRDFKNELDQADLQNLKELKDDISSAANELKRTADEAVIETEKSGKDLKDAIESVSGEPIQGDRTPQSSSTAKNNDSLKPAKPVTTATSTSDQSDSSQADEETRQAHAQKEPHNDLQSKAPA